MTEEKFYIKIISQQAERLVAACDKEIINVSLLSRGIKVRATNKFYGEELVTENELIEEIKKCTQANVIGNNVIELLVRNRFIHKEAILWLDNPENKNQKVGHAILIK